MSKPKTQKAFPDDPFSTRVANTGYIRPQDIPVATPSGPQAPFEPTGSPLPKPVTQPKSAFVPSKGDGGS